MTYSGPEEWSFRRFILHYAALCAAAGGVHAFCIGSELPGLTRIRGAGGFAVVESLRALAGEVRALLGADVKIGYAADWSEYFGYQPDDGSGDRYFNLDPLWADPEIDFIGIDNYMPLSDWRDGTEHADAGWGSIYNTDYLAANIEGGEGYDWYYRSEQARRFQIRTPIVDEAHGEAWVWRYKDIRNWWANSHHERIGGVRQAQPTAWVPQSKPIWFTEIGCAAIDKGTNQPNKFLDPKSSESRLPHFSSGARDDLIQQQYLRALIGYWSDPAHNPVSEVYGAPMIAREHIYVWAWDARPFPAFPNASDLWSDGANYSRGHWINGRIGARTLASVVSEICDRAGLPDHDVSNLHGYVRGYVTSEIGEARAALQPLMLRHGFDAVERDGLLRFVTRGGIPSEELATDAMADSDEIAGTVEQLREAEAELSGRVRLRFAEADADFDVISEEAVLPDEVTHAVATDDLPMALTRSEGRQVAERWLLESRLARDTVRFALPPSRLHLGAGDVVTLEPGSRDVTAGRYRIDRVEMTDRLLVEAVRIEPDIYKPLDLDADLPTVRAFVPPVPVMPLFMDLPLLRGDEVPHAPHLAVTGDPWPGSVALYASISDENYALSEVGAARATAGVTETALNAAPPGRWDEGAALQVRLTSGQLESRNAEAVLNGANLMAIGDGSTDRWELFQFREAELIAPDTYLLRGRLRGQLGSDGIMPDVWPAGSWVVLMDGVPEQIDLPAAHRRLAKHYRIGPARRGYDDPSYTHVVAAFDGNGLRPYAPCHLSLSTGPGGDLAFSWIRRTRIDGDSWDLAEVPLGEEAERYIVRVEIGDAVLREERVSAPHWIYSAAAQAADGVGEGAKLAVAQVSALYGPGLFARIALPVVR